MDLITPVSYTHLDVYKRQEGKFYEPFDPKEGANFAPSPGFHEGNAWNYTFFVPHDINGLVNLMGADKKFVDKLQSLSLLHI